MINEVVNDEISKIWLALYVAICLIIFFGFDYLGLRDQGVVAGFSYASIALSIRSRWDLRFYVWYWVLVGVVTIAHILAIFLIDWKLVLHPTMLYAPIVIFDFAGIMFIIHFFENIIENRKKL